MPPPPSSPPTPSKRLSGMFPWRRSSTSIGRKSVYGSTSSFHNPGHFPVISEPVLNYSTADFIASTDFKSTPDTPIRPVPSIHQYKPSQHVINTRNSVMNPLRTSTRLSIQTQIPRPSSLSSPSIGIPSPQIDRRQSSTLFPISANTTCPLAAPDHSDDPTQAAVLASTMATATAVFSGPSPVNASNRRNSTASPISRPTSMVMGTHFNLASPVSPTELKSKLKDSEQRAIDILIEYQQKLDKARKRIMDLEKKLQEESKAKRQISAQAAQATAAAVVAQSSIRNLVSPYPSSSVTSFQSRPDLTPASFLSSNNVVPPTTSVGNSQNLPSSNPASLDTQDQNAAAYTNQNITAQSVLAKMSNTDLQARVSSLETQRETLRNALKSLRTARDLESKQYQDQIARLKKQGAYQEFIYQRQSAMLYNTSPTSSDTSHHTLGQSPMYSTFPSPSFAAPLTTSASYASLPVSSATSIALPSPRLKDSATPVLSMSLPNGSNSSFKAESRLRIKRTGTAIPPILPTSHNQHPAGPNSPVIINARPRKRQHQRSRSLFTNPLSMPSQVNSFSGNNTKQFRNLSLYSNLRDDDKSSTCGSNRASVISDYIHPQDQSQDTNPIYNASESNSEHQSSTQSLNSTSVATSLDLANYTFESSTNSHLNGSETNSTNSHLNDSEINSPSSSSSPIPSQPSSPPTAPVQFKPTPSLSSPLATTSSFTFPKPKSKRTNSISSIASRSSVRGLIARYSHTPPPNGKISASSSSSSVADSLKSVAGTSSPQTRLGDLISSSSFRKKSRRTTVGYLDQDVPKLARTQSLHEQPVNKTHASPPLFLDTLTSLNNVNVRASVSDYAASIDMLASPAQCTSATPFSSNNPFRQVPADHSVNADSGTSDSELNDSDTFAASQTSADSSMSAESEDRLDVKLGVKSGNKIII